MRGTARAPSARASSPAASRWTGRPLEDAATYRVATNSFLYGGGDGFTVFAEGAQPAGGPGDLAALEAYIAAAPRVAGPPEGRHPPRRRRCLTASGVWQRAYCSAATPLQRLAVKLASHEPLDTPAGFDDPVAMWMGCHRRIEKQLKTLSKLCAHVAGEGVDAEASSAAQSILRYFEKSGAHHHEDEDGISSRSWTSASRTRRTSRASASCARGSNRTTSAWRPAGRS